MLLNGSNQVGRLKKKHNKKKQQEAKQTENTRKTKMWVSFTDMRYCRGGFKFVGSCFWNWLIMSCGGFVTHLGARLIRPEREENTAELVSFDVRCAAAASYLHHLQVKTKTKSFLRMEKCSETSPTVFLMTLVWLRFASWCFNTHTHTHTQNSMWDDALLCTLPGECQRFSIGLTHFKWFTCLL